ncbi:MAG: murein hydrolase activator EnvC family protein [Gaiellaceae bacterium]
MGIAALVTALVLHVHAVQARQQLLAHPVMPAQGTITSPFGRDGARWHPGIDIGVLRSLSVRAAVPGQVIHVGEVPGYEGYGNVVVVRSRGYEEIYGHLAAWRVRVGQLVVPGQHIATAGCTGWCTGTHLHFEVRKHGKAVSPFATLLRPFSGRPATQPRLLVSGAPKRQPTRVLSFAAPR